MVNERPSWPTEAAYRFRKPAEGANERSVSSQCSCVSTCRAVAIHKQHSAPSEKERASSSAKGFPIGTMGIGHDPAASPSESEESFVSAELDNTVATPSKLRSSIDQSASERTPLPSSSSRRQGHQPSKSAASTSPTRNRRLNERAQQHADTTPLPPHDPSTPLSPSVG